MQDSKIQIVPLSVLGIDSIAQMECDFVTPCFCACLDTFNAGSGVLIRYQTCFDFHIETIAENCICYARF